MGKACLHAYKSGPLDSTASMCLGITPVAVDDDEDDDVVSLFLANIMSCSGGGGGG